MFISKLQTDWSRSTGTADQQSSTCFGERAVHHRKTRSLSSITCEDLRAESFVRRLEPTFEYKSKGFKGNTRGRYIQEAFLTLEELLLKLPESIAFNIEISRHPQSEQVQPN